MRRPILFVFVAALGAGGCGTVMNLEREEPKVFGGTRMGVSDFSGGHQFGGIVGGPVCIADKPFSVVGDLVTLPYVLWLADAHARYERGEDRPKQTAPTRPSAPGGVPEVVGMPVTEARRAAEADGFLFVCRGGSDGVPLSAAQYRRIVAEVKDGVVVVAHVFPGNRWP